MGEKGTKESKISLGSWLDVCEANKNALILQNIEFYNSERKSNACDLQVSFKFSCKKDDFPTARSRMLMKPF